MLIFFDIPIGTMKAAIVVPPRDFRDESVSKLKMMMEKWGIDPVITSYSTHDCVGTHGAVYKPAMNASAINPDDFDAIVLIDGKGVDEYKLYDFRPLLDTVKLFSMRNKVIAGMGNSIKIIARANIITNVKIAIPREQDTSRLVILYHGTPAKGEMESDRNILTLSNAERIMEFSDMLLKKLGAK